MDSLEAFKGFELSLAFALWRHCFGDLLCVHEFVQFLLWSLSQTLFILAAPGTTTLIVLESSG